MFCGECGTQNPDTNQFCKNCGKPLRKPPQAPVPQPAAVPVQPVTSSPVPTVSGTQPQGMPLAAPPGYALVPVASTTDKLLTVGAIIGFVVSIVSWVRYPYLCGILAIVMGAGIFSKTKNKKSKTAILAILAIIIGLASIVFDVFYLMIMPPVPPAL